MLCELGVARCASSTPARPRSVTAEGLVGTKMLWILSVQLMTSWQYWAAFRVCLMYQCRRVLRNGVAATAWTSTFDGIFGGYLVGEFALSRKCRHFFLS